jgi:hypothetical protein
MKHSDYIVVGFRYAVEIMIKIHVECERFFLFLFFFCFFFVVFFFVLVGFITLKLTFTLSIRLFVAWTKRKKLQANSRHFRLRLVQAHSPVQSYDQLLFFLKYILYECRRVSCDLTKNNNIYYKYSFARHHSQEKIQEPNFSMFHGQF